MRILVLALVLLVMPMVAIADEATPPAGPSLAETAPPPHTKLEPLSAGHKAVIAIGALAGVVVANIATGGFLTPVLAAGFFEAAPAAPAVVSAATIAQTSVVAAEETYFVSVGRIAVTAAGAVIGGELAGWLYQE
jgi:hypothetical protein